MVTRCSSTSCTLLWAGFFMSVSLGSRTLQKITGWAPYSMKWLYIASQRVYFFQL